MHSWGKIEVREPFGHTGQMSCNLLPFSRETMLTLVANSSQSPKAIFGRQRRRHAIGSLPRYHFGTREGVHHMSLHPHTPYRVPEDTQRVARAAFPHGNIYMEV